jgi:hypothetical protein
MTDRVDLASLRPGQALTIGGKVFARCADCREIVRMDKPMFGSLHLCTDRRLR